MALAQAAAVIKTQHLTYSAYLARLRRIPVAGLLAPVPGGQYQRGIAAAILLSLETITSGEYSKISAAVMDLLAVLSPVGVPRELIRRAVAAGLVATDPASERTADAADTALGRLAETSLVTFSTDSVMVTAHRLVQRVVRDQLTGAGRLAVVCQFAAGLLEAEAAQLVPDWHENRIAVIGLIGQIDALYQATAPCRTNDQVNRAMLSPRWWEVFFLTKLGDSAALAITAAESLIAEQERILGPDHPDTLRSRNSLAVAYRAAGRTAEVIPLHERTLADRERILGPYHRDTLISRNNLAVAYQEAGRTTEAIALDERTLAARERTLGPDHPDTLNSRSNLADSYREAGRTAEAIALYERAIADMERTLGPDHFTA